jgi:hypothetical protein
MLTGPTRLERDQVIRLLHRCDDGLNVQRPDRPQVDDFDLDTILLLQNLSGFQCVGDVLAVGDDGDVGSLLFNLGLADGEDKVFGELFGGEGEGDTVQQLVLEETDGVGVPNGGLARNWV